MELCNNDADKNEGSTRKKREEWRELPGKDLNLLGAMKIF
jgi:hypothetical protein